MSVHRRVFIATPTYTGKVSMIYAAALANTFRMAQTKNIQLELIYTRCDALVQKTRNYFVASALKNNVDDLIFIDDDIQWEPDWIFKLLSYPMDVVSGIYRKKFDHAEEYPFIPIENENEEWFPPPIDTQTGLIEVAAVPTGFLRLTKKAMLALWNASEPYNNGQLHEERAIFDMKIMNGTLYSEDFIMSQKLRNLGIKIWLDPRMPCHHEGPKIFEGRFDVWLENQAHNNFWPNLWSELKDTTLSKSITYNIWKEMWSKPTAYLEYLKKNGFNPRVIYDIGACWGEWSAIAKRVWPDAQLFLFEACADKQPFIRLRGEYHIGVLSDSDNKKVKFYINTDYPGGNSYYIENTPHYSTDRYMVTDARTLDSVVAELGFPPPDLVKIDVQGAEIDVINGAAKTLGNASHLIVELQHVEYNKGAHLVSESLPIIESKGFKCIAPLFHNNGPDGDYGFIREIKY